MSESEAEEETQIPVVPLAGKKLKTKVGQPVEEAEAPQRSAGFEDFDKKQKKGGLRIVFKNPLEAKNVKGDEEADNTKGRKVYSINMANKLSKRQEREFDEDEGQKPEKDYFVGDDEGDADEDEFGEDDGATDKKKPGFKERMKEKRKQAKLDKEAKREQKKQLREQIFSKKNEVTAGLELVAGDQDSDQEFQADMRDGRFNLDGDDMEIDPTSNMYNKSKHERMLQTLRQKKLSSR